MLTNWNIVTAGMKKQASGLLVDWHTIDPATDKDASSRKANYRDLFAWHLSKKLVHEIRTALGFSVPLGSARFRKQAEGAPGRSIGQAKRRRPAAWSVRECE